MAQQSRRPTFLWPFPALLSRSYCDQGGAHERVRPFRDVKLQWLQELICDRDLSDSARSVVLYIITTHLNGHTEKAWPFNQTIADATGKSVKTIQRTVGELVTSGWFEVQRRK